MSTVVLSSLAEATDQAVAKLDVERLLREYWDQNGLFVIPQFFSLEFIGV